MKPIAVAMSGGVDSSVSAYLLKQEGHPVFGIHFVTGYEPGASGETGSSNVKPDSGFKSRPIGKERIHDIADRIGIRLHVLDIREEFDSTVVDYFVRTFASGKTPNPCMVCNTAIKFGRLFSAAREWGAERLATGHYAGLEEDASGRLHLLRGRDRRKEQSYFLARLTRDQLSCAVFPLLGRTKPEVRKIAADIGLADLIRKESQDICFVGKNAYGEFLNRKGIPSRPGPIVDVSRRFVGEHPGLHLFTIGQRKGINCPAAEPYYVVRIEPAENRLVVGRKEDLLASQCRVEEVNWIQPAPSSPISVYTRLRYRHDAVLSMVHPADDSRALVRFERPESAVTPGQCAVFYRGNEVLGSGWIEGKDADV
jgi:tRNA-specific 2-thiouridylase